MTGSAPRLKFAKVAQGSMGVLGDVAVGAIAGVVIAAILTPTKAPRQPPHDDPRGIGISLYRQGRHGAALQYLDRALRLRPNDAISHLYRGYALASLGRYRKALRALVIAISLNPRLCGHVPAIPRLARRLGRFANLRILAAVWRIVAWVGTRLGCPPCAHAPY